MAAQTKVQVLAGLCLLFVVVPLWGCESGGPRETLSFETTSGSSISTPTTAEEEFVYDNIAGEPASGPVPQEILDGVERGSVESQLAKYLWEHHGLMIETEDGHYLVPLPVRIPKGFKWPPEVISYDPSSPRGDPLIPVFLSPDEHDLFVQLWRQNGTIRIEQGEDGYRHIVE